MVDAAPSSALWRTLVERLDEGVIVLGERGTVIYANDQAAGLLDYSPKDVLGLDMDDLIALCQPDRLDVERLATLLRLDLIGPTPEEWFRVATLSRHLLIAPLAVGMETGRVLILLMREDTHWRGDLIAEAVMSEFRSPLAFTGSYCEALLARIQAEDAYREELVEFARIVRNGVQRTLAMWESLYRLYETDPLLGEPVEFEPVDLGEVILAAVLELDEQALHSLPQVKLDIPSGLPRVRAAPKRLHHALCELLAEAISRTDIEGQVRVKATRRRDKVQVDLALGQGSGMVRNYIFDGLPLSIVEQVIVQHSGRLWIDSEIGQPTVFSFTLPVWKDST